MLACILILIFFLPAALLPCALCTFFSSHEPNEMGIQLDVADPGEPMAEVEVPFVCLSVCL